jgi:hypothetical protein
VLGPDSIFDIGGNMKKSLLLILLGMLILSLSACIALPATDGKLELGRNESWEFQITLFVYQSDLALVSGTVNESMNDLIDEVKGASEDIDVSWEIGELTPEGTIPYTVVAKGKGYDAFNDAFFSERVLWIDESGRRPVIVFEHDVDGDLFSMGIDNHFEISGKKIISSNGVENGKSVSWHNPSGVIRAEMQPGGFPWVVVLVAGLCFMFLAVVVAGVVIFLVVRKNKQKTEPVEAVEVVEAAETAAAEE